MKSRAARPDATGPGNVFAKDLNFFRRKQVREFGIAQDREAGFLMRDFCAERIDETDASISVSLSQWMVDVTTFQKFMNDHPLIYDIDAEIAPRQMETVITQFIRIGDYRFITLGSKVLSQYLKLAFGSHAFPVDDCDLWSFFLTAPFSIHVEQI